MAVLELPELPDNYRWKVKAKPGGSYDAVTLQLQRKSVFGFWVMVRHQYIRDTLLSQPLDVEVGNEAIQIYDQVFGVKTSKEIEGIYGDD